MLVSSIFLLVISIPARAAPVEPRSLVFMISDGFGQTSEALARAYMQLMDAHWTSPLDPHLVGSTRTKSTSLVTDSAAGATAFACTQKTYNGAIAVDANGRPCVTIMEAAHRKGYLTGLVTTARITHATPAAFAAHVADRDMEDLIAEQLVNSSAVDLLMGGGRCHFVPHDQEGSCRNDSTNLLTNKYNMQSNLNITGLPTMALFANNHMSYEIDRTDQPSLSEMTRSALSALAQTNRAFFVMIEGARIDMAGHDNDPATHLHEILEYWRTVEVVKKFVDQNPHTLLVSTSDHETGGLTLGIDPEYIWHPGFLAKVTRSAETICQKLKRHQEDDMEDSVGEAIKKHLGIHDASESEIDGIVKAVKDAKVCKRAVGNVVSRRAHIGWSTGGHTGADVGLYAYGRESSRFHGSMENTEVGRELANYLSLDLSKLTINMPVVSKRTMFAHTYIDHN
ncbi:vacuolar alkaline phosphatase [Coemansia spiralis]|uniref:Alkaline phosphatase n=1 Tax=Coemansia spiralis TaxID=417178 RepID=A0A9W8KVW3_9FUNG|nr:vacuolar alkaline phosphatase [Coemansia sp. RSA 1358]KAJ2670535.1 vacuolar alkaline phosphatase [Coemansia spiralis]